MKTFYVWLCLVALILAIAWLFGWDFQVRRGSELGFSAIAAIVLYLLVLTQFGNKP